MKDHSLDGVILVLTFWAGYIGVVGLGEGEGFDGWREVLLWRRESFWGMK